MDLVLLTFPLAERKASLQRLADDRNPAIIRLVHAERRDLGILEITVGFLLDLPLLTKEVRAERGLGRILGRKVLALETRVTGGTSDRVRYDLVAAYHVGRANANYVVDVKVAETVVEVVNFAHPFGIRWKDLAHLPKMATRSVNTSVEYRSPGNYPEKLILLGSAQFLVE